MHFIRKSERGATFLEFAVAFPIFIVIVLAIVDLSRFIFLQSMADEASAIALEKAIIIPHLDRDDQHSEEFQGAQYEVLKAVTKLPVANSLKWVGSEDDGREDFENTDNVELILPEPVFGTTMRELMRRIPLRVQVHGTYEPILPLFPSFTIAGTATGFRELPPAHSEPIPVDCQGNPLGSLNFGSSSGCECDDNLRRFVWDSKNCECKYGLKENASGQCVCQNENQNIGVIDSSSVSCVGCNLAAEDCGGELIVTPECTCGCPDGRIRNGINCECAAGRQEVLGECECIANASSCTAAQIFDEDTCGCGCQGDGNIRCDDTGGTYDSANCACLCPDDGRPIALVNGQCECVATPAEQTCTGGQVFNSNPNRCNCECPSGTTWIDNYCRPDSCDGTGLCIWDDANKKCICPEE